MHVTGRLVIGQAMIESQNKAALLIELWRKTTNI